MAKSVEGGVEPVNNYGRYRQPTTARRGEPVSRYDGHTDRPRPPPGGLARTPIKDVEIARAKDELARRTRELADLDRTVFKTAEEAVAARAKERRLRSTVQELQRGLDRLTRHDTVLGALSDPWGSNETRYFVAIDRRVDILEMERSHGRISEAAYLTGRHVQAVLERQGKVKSVDWGGTSRGDPAMANELKIILCVMNASEILQLTGGIERQIGRVGMHRLRRVLGDRMSFADCAAMGGKGGNSSYAAQRFRDDLEAISSVFAALGKTRPTPDDDYKRAAVDVGARQAAALAGGASLARYEAELVALRDELATTRSFRQRARLTAEIRRLEQRLSAHDPDRVFPATMV